MYNKKINLNYSGRDAILKGLNTTADAVKSTLGAKGKTVIIEVDGMKPHITKDGVTVAQQVKFKDRLEQIGSELLVSAAEKTVDEAGDGTTTTTVLTQSIINKGLKLINTEVTDAIKLCDRLDLNLKWIKNALNYHSMPIDNSNDLFNIATTSANNDSVLGGYVVQAIEAAGSGGEIEVLQSVTGQTYVEKIEGNRLDRGLLSPFFINNEDNSCTFEEPLFLVQDYKATNASNYKEIVKMMNGRPLVIIAPDFDGNFVNTIIANVVQKGLKFCLVKAPMAGTRQKEALKDIAILVGATLLSEETNFREKDFTEDSFGSCERFKAFKEYSVIYKGYSKKDIYEERLKRLKSNIESCDNDFDKKEAQEVLSSFLGGAAIIYVDSKTEEQFKEVRDRLDDSIKATRASLEEGIIEGGGITLVKIREDLKEKSDIHIEDTVILDSLLEPFNCIVTNGGFNKEVVLDKVLSKDKGFNVKSGEYVDMIEDGIVDPKKVTRVAIENAVEVAKLIFNSNCVISIDDEQ